MDDSRKRISRERLEPYFRLHREAHLNIIRNWLGQNTEDVFYDLATNTVCWCSTISGFRRRTFKWSHRIRLCSGQCPRRHQPVSQSSIDRPLVRPQRRRAATHPQRGLGGPRGIARRNPLLHGSSNSVNLQASGRITIGRRGIFYAARGGFSVEVGTPHFRRWSRCAHPYRGDLWPLDDTYAYHDWHFGGMAMWRRSCRRLPSSTGRAPASRTSSARRS